MIPERFAIAMEATVITIFILCVIAWTYYQLRGGKK